MFEALTEGAGLEEGQDAWGDAAGDVDAAAGAGGQGDVAGHGAEDGAEAGEGLAAMDARIVQRLLGDLGRVVFRDGGVGDGVAGGLEVAADEAAAVVGVGGAGVGTGNDGAGDGAMASLCLVVLVAHGSPSMSGQMVNW